MQSNYYIPHQSYIRDIIQCIWHQEAHPGFLQELIVPKGVLEIVFNFSDHVINGKLQNQKFELWRCFINGFNRNPIEVNLPYHLEFFGIQVQPAAVKKIFGIPASEFADQLTDLSLVNASFSSLWEQLAEKANFSDRVCFILSWLKTKTIEFQPREKAIDAFISNSCLSNITVPKLADELCYSERQLARKFLEVCAMNTEEFLLYKKYLHALHLMHFSNQNLTEIAFSSNFSDQSHFIRTFKNYSAITPKEYRKNKGHIKGHVFTNVR